MNECRITDAEDVVRRWNDVFRAVSAEPRRQLITSLLEAEPGATVSLPESATNPNVPVEEERLLIELHHRHLPLLADDDFVEWERNPLVAARGSRFGEVATVFEAIRRNASDTPDSLVVGCEGLERARHTEREESSPG